MSYIYILAGFVLGFIVFSYAIYQGIASLLISSIDKPISEDQKEVCKKANASARKTSPYCSLYIKKGKCGSKTCDVIK